MKKIKILFLIAFFGLVISTGCEEKITPTPTPIPEEVKEVVLGEVTSEVLADSVAAWNISDTKIKVFIEALLINSDWSDADIERIFDDSDNIDIAPMEIKLVDNEVESTEAYSFLLDQDFISISGNVTVSHELSAKEESKLDNNNVSITNNGGQMLFNNPDVPVTDAVIAYYGNYFTGDKSPYVLSTPDEQTEMGDVTRNELHTNTTPVEGEKYFKNGNYCTTYDPSDDYWDRMDALSAIRQDTTYFDNTWTSDSTSYKDVNGDYITNLVLQR